MYCRYTREKKNDYIVIIISFITSNDACGNQMIFLCNRVKECSDVTSGYWKGLKNGLVIVNTSFYILDLHISSHIYNIEHSRVKLNMKLNCH